MLTAINSCTSQAFAVPLPYRRGANAVKLIETIISLLGKPTTLCSDNEFVSLRKIFDPTNRSGLYSSLTAPRIASLCNRNCIKQDFSTAHHPQANGEAERHVKLVKQMRARLCSPDQQLQWDEFLFVAVEITFTHG